MYGDFRGAGFVGVLITCGSKVAKSIGILSCMSVKFFVPDNGVEVKKRNSTTDFDIISAAVPYAGRMALLRLLIGVTSSPDVESCK